MVPKREVRHRPPVNRPTFAEQHHELFVAAFQRLLHRNEPFHLESATDGPTFLQDLRSLVERNHGTLQEGASKMAVVNIDDEVKDVAHRPAGTIEALDLWPDRVPTIVVAGIFQVDDGLP